MKAENIVGTIALAITLIYTCFGMPVQIYHNYINKSTAGLSLFMMFMTFLTFSGWVTYASVKSPMDFYILSSNIPGALFTAVVLYQFFHYRGRGR